MLMAFASNVHWYVYSEIYSTCFAWHLEIINTYNQMLLSPCDKVKNCHTDYRCLLCSIPIYIFSHMMRWYALKLTKHFELTFKIRYPPRSCHPIISGHGNRQIQLQISKYYPIYKYFGFTTRLKHFKNVYIHTNQLLYSPSFVHYSPAAYGKWHLLNGRESLP